LLAELCAESMAFPRHLSQHVGGRVISSVPLVALVPREPARMAGRVVTQWDKDGAPSRASSSPWWPRCR